MFYVEMTEGFAAHPTTVELVGSYTEAEAIKSAKKHLETYATKRATPYAVGYLFLEAGTFSEPRIVPVAEIGLEPGGFTVMEAK